MHEGFRKIPKPVSPPIPDSAQAKAMGIDFLAIINKALQHQSIKNYRCGESFAKLTAPYNAEHFLFLIPCGYTRMAENPKQPPKAVTPAQIVGTHLASTKLSDDSTANFMFFPNGQQMHAQESNIYALIYHKSSGRFTWYRQQFFLKEKIHPMQRKYLKKQLDYLLKEYL
jgi:hypothetical protein